MTDEKLATMSIPFQQGFESGLKTLETNIHVGFTFLTREDEFGYKEGSAEHDAYCFGRKTAYEQSDPNVKLYTIADPVETKIN